MLAIDTATDTLGARIKRVRKAHGLSQKALAERAGISWRGLAELESDKLQGMQTRHLGALCRALGCTSDWLLGINDDGATQPLHTDINAI